MLGGFAKDYWSLTEKPSESAQCLRRAALNSSDGQESVCTGPPEGALSLSVGGVSREKHGSQMLSTPSRSHPVLVEPLPTCSENSTHRPGTTIAQRAGLLSTESHGGVPPWAVMDP